MAYRLIFEFDASRALKELIKDAELLPLLSKNLYRFSRKRNIQADREKVIITLIDTNITILYIYFLKGVLADALDPYVISHPEYDTELYDEDLTANGSIPYKIYWGSMTERRYALTKICEMLSSLSVNTIAMSSECTEQYHEIAKMIERDRQGKNTAILNDYRFWDLFFRFYVAYRDPARSADCS